MAISRGSWATLVEEEEGGRAWKKESETISNVAGREHQSVKTALRRKTSGTVRVCGAWQAWCYRQTWARRQRRCVSIETDEWRHQSNILKA
jgi:hypothetical protein